MANRLFLILLALILGMQTWILYRQYRPSDRDRSRLASGSLVEDVNAEMELGGLPTLGSGSAKVGIVEFSDFECPFCERYASHVAPKLKEEFVSSGKLLYAFANNPLPIHVHAKLLASGAICATTQDFWKMHDRIFSDKPRTPDELKQIAGSLGLNVKEYSDCLDDGTFASKRIERDMKTADRLGVRATPAFAIGVVNGERLSIKKIVFGAQSIDVFQRALRDTFLLAGS